ncbi:MAG: hypothetical protein K2F87_00690 [Muribaculaceae bacterium]|nr:hypothetical protein [Muribaculaceae bacterium]
MTQNRANAPQEQLPMLTADTLRQMLDLTYELEGLLHLALGREDAPARIACLISAKISELSSCRPDHTPLPETTPENEKENETAEVAAEEYETDDFSSYDLDDDEPEPAPVIATVKVPDLDPEPDPVVTPASRHEDERPRQTAAAPVFSLNDRFLYSRELFGGRVTDFETALKEIASMESYEEAEEYFITERGFNPELPVVQDFFAVISNYFD